MTFEILRKQPVKFYHQNGLKIFEPFKAVDKNKKTLELSWNLKPDYSSIMAKSTYNNDMSIYNIDTTHNGFKGISLVANPQKKEIGEVLNLASLITFKENNISHFDVFALRDYIQFYAKYGFNIFSNNINEILHNLKYLAKSKEEKFSDMVYSAKYFRSQLEKNATTDNKLLSNNLISDYLRTLSRNGRKIDADDLYSHTHMRFSSLDEIRNRDYLNELLDKHEINYKI
ncbi:hypothetical protein J6N69_01940 [bacterium]|nr:hypothetical protein [bacterium]MBP3846689.1 hypothetical protein [bacterium]